MKTSIDYYNKNGFTPPIDIFTREESLSMRQRFFETIGQTEDDTQHRSDDIANWHNQYDWCKKIVTDKKIVSVVSEIFGSTDLVAWSMLFWYKSAFDKTFIPWHQDGTFWPMSPCKTVTAWLALGDVDENNGALHFIPGLHENLTPAESLDDPDSDFIYQCPTNNQDETETCLDMQAGQVCLFDAKTIHRSGPNRSSKARVGCAIRYAPSDVKFDLDKWPRYKPDPLVL